MMEHLYIRRLVVVLGILFAAAAALFAWVRG
jgi:HAMP domain-containing protein